MTIQFYSIAVPKRHVSIARIGGEYVVSITYPGQATRRETWQTREQAWERVEALGGVS